ncbi:TatD1 [Desulfamplus magnetovallimortis]|uniref:TatD1 n=1 Tax=Desulfamplus magnetovallimortis TaxID=1246637 RepID=A0A1W1HIN2_9BACT|nr:TatD family hydrolase [Desulfamplus magnetovallimortis]SLM32300.1 TatD1 [Desulfamplus magnetovallimortis]
MRLFDSHSHIDDKSFKHDFDEMLTRAYDADIKAIMVVGINPATTRQAIHLTKKYSHDNEHPGNNLKSLPRLFTSVGMHPHDAKKCSHDIIEEFKVLAKQKCVKAWGETGLDFNRMHSPKEDQEKWFTEQIAAANELNLPMIFHERDSDGRFLEILKYAGHREKGGVVHCFSGSKEEMSQYLDLGYYIGITGILTIEQRGRLLREIAVHIPDDRIVIETDAPYLTPAPMKNKTRRNEPAFVRHVMLKLAEIKGMDVESLADIIWNNTCRLYGINELNDKK